MQIDNKNIVLIGISGVGKSALGRELSNDFGMGFYDTDQQIESVCKQTVAEIIRQQGEASFRDLEKQQLGFIDNIKNHVISLGGGATESYLQSQSLTQSSMSIWLKVDVDVVVNRLLLYANEIQKRPLISEVFSGNDYSFEARKNNKHKMYELLNKQIQERKPFYEKADHIFELMDHNLSSNAKSLISFVKGDFKTL